MSAYEAPRLTMLGTVAAHTLAPSALCKRPGTFDEFGNVIETAPGECD